MVAIRHILFPTDFSECAEHAFSTAAALADRFDAEVVVFHARVKEDEANNPLTYYAADAPADENRPMYSLDDPFYKVIDVRDGERVRVVQAEIFGKTAEEAIVSFASRYDIDLIVMGTHGRHGPIRLLRGSTAEHVLRTAPCPVLTIKEDALAMFAKDTIEMLVPVDFSDYSREALHHAAELSRVFKSNVTLLHMVEEAVFPTVYGVEAAPISTVNLVLDRSREMLEKLAHEFFPSDRLPDMDVRIGHAASGITAFAEDNETDLIVMATHGLTGIKRFLMGSVAERVARHAPCAVFAVKPLGKSVLVAAGEAESSRHIR
ncbi:MAG: universal stress protein [Rhodothermales bacterium]